MWGREKEDASRKPNWPYKSLSDPQYIKDRADLLSRAGNGWWWGWTSENCPITDLRPSLRAREGVENRLNSLDVLKEKTRPDREQELKARRWLASGSQQGDVKVCPICKGPFIKKTLRTKYCGKPCSDSAYKTKVRLNNGKRLKAR